MSIDPPALLAIDASTDRLAIGACGPAGARYWSGPGGAAASASLLPQAHALLDAAGLHWRDLDAVAFGTGPGAFTGLRTACAVAQGLAFGAGCAVLPIDSLMIVAEAVGAAPGETLWVAMDARMDEVYAAEYRLDAAGWRVTSAPALYTLQALSARWRCAAPARVAGSALEAFGSRLDTGSARREPDEGDRTAALLRLAVRGHASGAGVDPALALPTYLRDKVALTTAERAAARAVAPGAS